jgi:16S rRNA (guanine527-N7)-methyltransferase
MMASENNLPIWLGVSRETKEKLVSYLSLVAKWNPTINLVSAASLAEGWNRHILDSAQLEQIAQKETGLWLDIGSGAGFPGLVIAIIAQAARPGIRVSLVESDRRKATFLSEAIRQLELPATVICDRVELLSEMGATVITARAFAPLDKLLGAVARHLSSDGVGIFLKGQQYLNEMKDAERNWTYDCEIHRSKTDDKSVVLRMRNIRHV